MLSRSEIIANAARFLETWKDAKDEDADAKSFWDNLFLVFGTPRRNVAAFEARVKMENGSQGYIDLLWKGQLLVEHKSLGKSLVDARRQAQEYALRLNINDRPKFIIVCDFQRFEVINQGDGTTTAFTLRQLANNIDALGFIGGFKPRMPTALTPVNIEAVELLGDIYDALKDNGYPSHDLAPLLVRILFALFAENTAIFEPDQFRNLILDRTKEDGDDLGAVLDEFFQILNTNEVNRQRHLTRDLAAFPYVNGALFNHRLPNAAMTKSMRDALLKATEFDWTQISPAIFGSLFQSVMEGSERRALGAHYTSEDDILKLLRPLFLDSLEKKFRAIVSDRSSRRDARLDAFQNELAELKFLDPACGCGNFLIVAYRELRKLETKILVERHKHSRSGTAFLDISLLVKLNVDAMYGIEIEEFPSEIAKVGMWLMDHICNTELAAEFGKNFTRLPLKQSATIVSANALALDWKSILRPTECSYLLGNPPFIGKKEQTVEQKAELVSAFGGKAKVGNLDYVCAWYAKASIYISSSKIRCAFVSTNSISQGEQVAKLWKHLFEKGIKIDFAHRTFPWRSEARGAAHVHVVIIGFSKRTTSVGQKIIFDHSDLLHVRIVNAQNINPYLVDAADLLVQSRSKPLSATAPKMRYGSMMIDKDRKAGDDEGLVFDAAERKRILASNPALTPYVKPIFGGEEYINGQKRFCLWVTHTPPQALHTCKPIADRIIKVKAFRLSSSRPQTKKLAAFPYRFGEIRQPKSTYLLIPKVSSEKRDYIPIGFVEPDTIASGSALTIDNSTLYEFGVLQSSIHNAWMRAVGGRLEMRYQYSSNIVYNNFCWPESPTPAQIAAVEKAANGVLKIRTNHSAATLADLYRQSFMPTDLIKAHQILDISVDKCYQKAPFASEMERVQFLFKLYENKSAPLTKVSKAKRRISIPILLPKP